MLDSEIIYRITNAKAHFLQGSLVSFVTEIDHRYAHPQHQGMKMQVFVFALERQRPQAQWEPIAIARQALNSRREDPYIDEPRVVPAPLRRTTKKAVAEVVP
ncbi:hypothetical protein ACPUEJ_23760 (plasmid) [Vibrio tubiashii]|uniref:hypothetical protein n=1 Tax=Vibrio tubiashii TaxID=29498 RepID=UPI003CE54A3D